VHVPLTGEGLYFFSLRIEFFLSCHSMFGSVSIGIICIETFLYVYSKFTYMYMQMFLPLNLHSKKWLEYSSEYAPIYFLGTRDYFLDVNE